MYFPIQKQFRGGKFKALAWEGVLVGYSVESPDYRVWDPETSNVYNIGGPAFNEEVEQGWWKKESSIKLLIPDEEEEELEFDSDATGEEVQPSTPSIGSPERNHEVSPTRSEGEEIPRRGGIGPWRYVDEPGVENIGGGSRGVEKTTAPRRSERGNLGVPLERLGDAMMLAMMSPDPDSPQSI